MPSFASDYLILNIVLFIAGLLFLIKGSDFFVEAASQIARTYKIPEIVIGLTLVSIGTSCLNSRRIFMPQSKDRLEL